jgi:hypothetical protein
MKMLFVFLGGCAEESSLDSTSAGCAIFLGFGAIREESRNMLVGGGGEKSGDIIIQGVLVLLEPSFGRVLHFGCVVSENEALPKA